MARNIKVTYGIHVLLNMYHILKSTSEEVNLQIDYDTLKRNRDDITDEYMVSYNLLVNEIFGSLTNVKLSDGNNYPLVDWITKGVTFIDTYIDKNNHFTKYEINNLKIDKPFVCINTKIVNSSSLFNDTRNSDYNFIEKYSNIKTELFNLLQSENFNVVMLGERSIPNCNEYNYHADNFGNYIMYDDIKNNLNNLIDETYSDSKDGYNLENWKKTCYYLTHSMLNIFVGNGGGLHLYSNFDNTVQLGVTDRLLRWVNPNNIGPRFTTTINTNNFLNEIKNNLI